MAVKLPRIIAIRQDDNMAAMANADAEVLHSELNPRHSVWTENDVHFTCKDVENRREKT